MPKNHRRVETMIYLKKSAEPQQKFEEIFLSSESSYEALKTARKIPVGSVYVQACKFCPDPCSLNDNDSFFNSSVEILISELDRISDGESKDDTSEFTRIMQDIMNQQIQNEYLRLAAKKELKHSLILSIKSSCL